MMVRVKAALFEPEVIGFSPGRERRNRMKSF